MTAENSTTKPGNLMSDQQMAAISEVCLSVPQLASALQPFAETPIAHFMLHHAGSPDECGTCGPILRARLALESAGLAWDDARQQEYNSRQADSCAECGVLAPDHAPSCGSVSMRYARIEFEAWRNDAGTRTLYLGELSLGVVHYHTEIDKEHIDHLIRAVNAHDSLVNALKLFLDLDGHSVSDTAIAVNAGLAALRLAESGAK